jgi:hypothetical protein
VSTASNPSTTPPNGDDRGRGWILAVAVVGWLALTTVVVLLATGCLPS